MQSTPKQSIFNCTYFYSTCEFLKSHHRVQTVGRKSGGGGSRNRDGIYKYVHENILGRN